MSKLTHTKLRSRRQHARLEYRHYPHVPGGGARRGPGVSRIAHGRVLPPLSPSAPVYGLVLRKRLDSGDSRQPFFTLFLDTRYPLVSCHRGWPCPSRDLPACTSYSCATCLGRRASTSIQFTPRPHPRAFFDISRFRCYIKRLSVESEF